MIYFAEEARSGLIKIGTSECVATRMKALESTRKSKISLLAVSLGGRREEKALHMKFADFGVGNEWFNPSPEITSFIYSLPALQVPDVKKKSGIKIQVEVSDKLRKRIKRQTDKTKRPALHECAKLLEEAFGRQREEGK